MPMQKTLLRPLFLLLLSLPFSLAAMSEDAIIAGCNTLDKELLERKEQIKQLQNSLKDTDTIVVTVFYKDHQHKNVIDVKDSKHKEAVQRYKNHLNRQIKNIEWHFASIADLRSNIDMISEKLPKEQGNKLCTAFYVKSLHDHRKGYQQLLESVSKDKELYEKDCVMEAIPAESQSEKKNDN
jgi:predicted RND superfamily exporter protein